MGLLSHLPVPELAPAILAQVSFLLPLWLEGLLLSLVSSRSFRRASHSSSVRSRRPSLSTAEMVFFFRCSLDVYAVFLVTSSTVRLLSLKVDLQELLLQLRDVGFPHSLYTDPMGFDSLLGAVRLVERDASRAITLAPASRAITLAPVG